MQQYDSRADTLTHIKRVSELLGFCSIELTDRAAAHDASKLQEPEKSAFDTCTLKLKAIQYGTPEYQAALAELKPALDHHYKNNSHHPEFYQDGIDGMDLFDILEMFVDWKAATERMAGGGNIYKSIEINAKRFNMSPQLVNIFTNTAKNMGWVDPEKKNV